MMTTSETNGFPKMVGQKRTILEVFLEHITTVMQVLLLALTVYIIWLCSGEDPEFSLVKWHVIICTIGGTFLMNECVLCMSEHNVFTKYLEHVTTVKVHMFFFAVGFGLVCAGFAIIITEFELDNRSHFSTTHGALGLVVIVFGTAAYLTGCTVYYHVRLEKYINPDLNKLCHAIFGAVTLILGTAATISGLYTVWFKDRVDGSYATIELCLVITVLTFAWTLLQPLLGNYKRIKRIAN